MKRSIAALAVLTLLTVHGAAGAASNPECLGQDCGAPKEVGSQALIDVLWMKFDAWVRLLVLPD